MRDNGESPADPALTEGVSYMRLADAQYWLSYMPPDPPDPPPPFRERLMCTMVTRKSSYGHEWLHVCESQLCFPDWPAAPCRISRARSSAASAACATIPAWSTLKQWYVR